MVDTDTPTHPQVTRGDIVEAAKAIHDEVVAKMQGQLDQFHKSLPGSVKSLVAEAVKEQLPALVKAAVAEVAELFKSLPGVTVSVPRRRVKKLFTYHQDGRPAEVIEEEIPDAE